MADRKISKEVADILRSAELQGSVVRLRCGPLARELYNEVDGALKAMGGKWSRKDKGHVFRSDPGPKIQKALESSVAVDEKKKFQAFFSPPAVAKEVVGLIDVKGHVVLEPEAGHGALADACLEAGASEVHCVELNPESVEVLQAKNYKEVHSGDFLQMLPPVLYGRIVMNPGFKNNDDIRHLGHALSWLIPEGGQLAAIMLATNVFTWEEARSRSNLSRREESLMKILAPYKCRVHKLPDKSFHESGTDVATMAIVIET